MNHTQLSKGYSYKLEQNRNCHQKHVEWYLCESTSHHPFRLHFNDHNPEGNGCFLNFLLQADGPVLYKIIKYQNFNFFIF